MNTARDRFILFATASYTILALAWIFLTDRLLSVFVDIESLVWLSTVKGVFFVITTSAALFLALRAVPPANAVGTETLLDSLSAGISPGKQPRWLMYTFALAITLATLLLRESIAVQFGSRPLLILFMFPIILSALLGGLGPGLVSTAAAGFGVSFLAIPPLHSFRIAASHDLIQWAFLIANGVAVSLLSEVLRRALAKAEINRRLLDTVVSGTSDAIFVKDTQGRYLLANAATAGIVGKSQDEIIGHDDYFLFPETSARKLMAADRAIMSDGLIRTFEERIATLDGKVLDFLVSKGPVFNRTGQVVGMFGISRDITERKRTEATYRSLYDNIMNSVVLCRLIFENDQPVDLEYISTNPAFAEVTGIRENPVGRRISEVIPGYCEHNQESLALFARVAETGEPARWEHYLAELDRWFSFYIYSTAPGEITIITENISSRKKAEMALRESEERLKHALAATREAVWDFDLHTGLIKHNHRWRELLGLTDESFEHPAEMYHGCIHPDDKDMVRTRIEAAMRDGADYGAEYRLRCGDGREIWVADHGRVVETDPDGRPLRIVGAFTDVTQRKRDEQNLRRESEKNQALLRNASDGIHILDADGRIIEASDSFCAMLGYRRDEMIGMQVSQWDAKFVGAELSQAVTRQFEKPGRSQFETRHKRKDGTVFDVEVSGFPLELDGRPVLFNSSRDITERKQADEKLHLAASVFTHAREGIMITEPDGTIIDVNDAFCHISGYSRDEALGRNPRLLNSGRHGNDFYTDLWHGLIENGYWSGEIWNRRKNGEVFAAMLTISSVGDIQGNTLQFVALFSDISALKEHEKQLKYIAHYDALTRLPNRVLLADRLHQAMSQAERHAQPLAVVYLDLDGFKTINDKHGHEAGDQLLISVASRMKQALREGDTLARLGGDEFVAVLLELGNIEASIPMFTRILAAAAQPLEIGDLVLQVSASLGVTFYPQAADVDADQLLRQADQAMYQAKLTGKNRYHVFDAELDNDIRGHHESLERIRLAMTKREFVLYYQPKVDMRRGKVIGAEALIRWQHPERGLLPPAIFLPVIEDHPLAVEIGEWVIDTALTRMEDWRAGGLDIPVSVNIGARQLQQPDFVERLQEILAAHPQIKPSRLELEVLETSALEDVAQVTRIIETCREIGVTFALDDFGTGYSSLTYLKRLPVTQLKIDQSFVRDMLDDPDDLAILVGVLGLAGAFRRQVIAEGMETVEHGVMLLQLGCELAQGYGIAHPMPGDDMPAWSAAWRISPAWVELSAISREDLPLLFAGVEHRAWIVIVENHINGLSEIPPLQDHHQCRFGNWLDTEAAARYGAQALIPVIIQTHREMHELVEQLCVLHTLGHSREALARLSELHDLRDSLFEHLQALARKTGNL